MTLLQIISITLLLPLLLLVTLRLLAPVIFGALYNDYSLVNTKINGAKAARQMLKHAGITDVHVSVYPFSDYKRNELCYHAELKAVFLTEDVYHSHSITAIAIACHEAAHAIQHAQGFKGILPFSFFIELDANRKALQWLGSDLARSVGGLNKWYKQSRSLLRWSLLTYLW